MFTEVGLVAVDFGEGFRLAYLAFDGQGPVSTDGGFRQSAADDVLDEVPLEVADAVEALQADVTGLE